MRANAILAGMDGARAKAVPEKGSLVTFDVRDRIHPSGMRISDVYFPIDRVLSVVMRMRNGREIEIGTVGHEGTSAMPLLLGGSTTANDAYCQVAGRAVRLAATLFKSLSADQAFRRSLDRYVQAYVNMLGNITACNRLHDVHRRCARWLLMTHDRVGCAQIRLAHEHVALMLGAPRSAATIAAATLQTAGLIGYGHGVITIRDRAGLERAACECYAQIARQFGDSRGPRRPVRLRSV